MWYKMWRWNLYLLLKLVFFWSLWAVKSKIIIAVVFVTKAQSNFLHTTADRLAIILQFQRSRNIFQVTQRKEKELRSKSVYLQQVCNTSSKVFFFGCLTLKKKGIIILWNTGNCMQVVECWHKEDKNINNRNTKTSNIIK